MDIAIPILTAIIGAAAGAIFAHLLAVKRLKRESELRIREVETKLEKENELRVRVKYEDSREEEENLRREKNLKMTEEIRARMIKTYCDDLLDPLIHAGYMTFRQLTAHGYSPREVVQSEYLKFAERMGEVKNLNKLSDLPEGFKDATKVISAYLFVYKASLLRSINEPYAEELIDRARMLGGGFRHITGSLESASEIIKRLEPRSNEEKEMMLKSDGGLVRCGERLIGGGRRIEAAIRELLDQYDLEGDEMKDPIMFVKTEDILRPDVFWQTTFLRYKKGGLDNDLRG